MEPLDISTLTFKYGYTGHGRVLTKFAAGGEPRVTRVCYTVHCPHPSGRRETEYGVNAFWFDSYEAAVAQFNLLGSGAKIERKTEIQWVPPKCSRPSTKCIWTLGPSK